MKNTSGLEPRGRAVLVQTYEPERKGGLIAIPDVVQEKTAMIEQRAVVIAIGPSCWHDEPMPRAKVGEKVLIAKFSGYFATGPADGKKYRIVNDRDIFCAITEEMSQNGTQVKDGTNG